MVRKPKTVALEETKSAVPRLYLPTIFQKKKDYTVTRTLRLNAAVDERLDGLSKREGVSVNVLANKTLRKLVDWEARMQTFGLVSVQKDTLGLLWDSLPEEKARTMGRKAGGQAAVDFSNFWFKKFSWDTMIEAARALRRRLWRRLPLSA